MVQLTRVDHVGEYHAKNILYKTKPTKLQSYVWKLCQHFSLFVRIVFCTLVIRWALQASDCQNTILGRK